MQSDGRFFYGAPTQQQAKYIFWKQLKRETTGLRSGKPNESELSMTLANGSEIIVVGLDRAERVEGQPWDGMHITEFPNCKPGIWSEHLLPLLADTGGFAILDGVPDARSGMAEEYRTLAEYAAGGTIPEAVAGQGAFGENGEWAFYTWWSEDVLGRDVLDTLQAAMDWKVFCQEFRGSFVNLEGLAYYAYEAQQYPNGNLDKSLKFDPSLPVFIGGDFNVDPMTATLAHHVIAQDGPNHNRKETLVFKGYYLRNSNTRQLYERIVNEHLAAPYFVLTPCQSSNARQTSAEIGVTDKAIIEDIFKKAGKVIHINSVLANPAIKDRINLTNARLFHKLIRVNNTDPALKELTADWATIPWKPGTSDLKLSEKRGHISAALDYSEFKHYDIRSMSREVIKPGVASGSIF